MKTDVIIVKSGGEGIETALAEVENVAGYKKLSGKETLQLRLIAEETMGMLRAITGEVEAKFWMEASGSSFELHLLTLTMMDAEKRKELLSASTSGENSAAKGFMGKLRDIIECALDPSRDAYPDFYTGGMLAEDIGAFDDPMSLPMRSAMESWSLSKYRTYVEETETSEGSDWDELEKSIVAKIADEVKIFIRGGEVEMVIYKKF